MDSRSAIPVTRQEQDASPAADAFRSGAGLVRLEPGERHTASWGIEPSERAENAPAGG
jgi:hypothetical protein